MRTLGTNLLADIDRVVTTPRLLIHISFDGQDLRYATGGDSTHNDIVFDGDTYQVIDIRVTGLDLSAGGSVKLVINNNDLVASGVFLNHDPSGGQVTIWNTAALSYYAGANDVVAVYQGEISGDVSGKPGQVVVNCGPAHRFFPNQFVNAQSGFTQLSPPGTYRFPTGSVVLTRDG